MCLQTTGAEVVVSQVQVPDTTTAVELYLIDTAGSELYQDQVPSYWNGAYFAILVFDISNQESFAACRSWYDLLKQSR